MRWIRLALAGVLLCSIAAMAAPETAHAANETWLDRVNEIRTASGLPPVTANAGWVTGLDDHLTYLEDTPASYETGQYASAHTENPSSPYYTSAGAQEAASSDLAFGTGSDLGAINAWLTAPFHAIGMLRPALTQVAFARHDDTGDAGLDVISGLTGGPAAAPVLFPGNGSTIGLTTYGGESPSPIETCTTDHPDADYSHPGLGLIAMLTQAPTGDLSVTLRQPDGTTISSGGNDLCVVDEQNYTSSDSVYGPTGKEILQGDHAVLIFPRQPLTAGDYTVDISQGGQPDITWSFTSQPATSAVAQSPHLTASATCSYTAGHSGRVSLRIVNPDEGAGPATYTVSLNGSTYTTSSVGDGDAITVTYSGLPPGSADFAVAGSDGSHAESDVRVAGCPAYQGIRVHFGKVRRGALAVVLDNAHNARAVRVTVVGPRSTHHKYTIRGTRSKTEHVSLHGHHKATFTAMVGTHRIAKDTVHR